MIPKEFQNTLSLNKRFRLIQYETTRYWGEEDYNNGSEELFDFEINKETGNTFINDIGVSFDEEYNKHIEYKLYFIGCPFSIYKNIYIKRLQQYLKENEADFYNKTHFVQQEMLDTLLYETSPYINIVTKRKLIKSISRRKEYLKAELNSLG